MRTTFHKGQETSDKIHKLQPTYIYIYISYLTANSYMHLWYDQNISNFKQPKSRLFSLRFGLRSRINKASNTSTLRGLSGV